MLENINLRDITLPLRGAWNPLTSFVSATNSRGEIVPKSELKMFGLVNVCVPGSYPVTFQFEDPYTKKKVEACADVIISDKDEKEIKG